MMLCQNQIGVDNGRGARVAHPTKNALVVRDPRTETMWINEGYSWHDALPKSDWR